MKKDFIYYYKKLIYAERELAASEYMNKKVHILWRKIKVFFYQKKCNKYM